jgi:molecular chaperone GrpE
MADNKGPFIHVSGKRLRELRGQAAQAEEMLETARRVQAEFIRYQDRMKKEKETWTKYGIENLIKELLPALDAFDNCLGADPAPEVSEGVRLVEREILRTLSKFGVTVIEAQDQPFDPRLHQAVEAVADKKRPANTVMEVVKRGFRLHDRVVRPAMVRVSKGPAKA